MKQPRVSNGLSESGQAFRRRPIVLARLPHVDAATGSVSPPVAHAATTRKSPPSTVTQQTKFFVDPRHVSVSAPEEFMNAQMPSERVPNVQVERPSQLRRHDQNHASDQESQLGESYAMASQPSSAASFGFVRLHGQLASAASSIVTLALVVAAGLMVWMIVVPTRIVVNDLPPVSEGYGAAAITIPEFSIAQEPVKEPVIEPVIEHVEQVDSFATENSVESPATEDSTTIENPIATLDDGQSVTTDSPVGSPAENYSWHDAYRAAQVEPPSEPAALPQESPAELIRLPEAEAFAPMGPLEYSSDPSVLSFPTTSYSEQLDFSKLGVSVEESTEERVPATQTKPLPALFQRPESPRAEPVSL